MKATLGAAAMPLKSLMKRLSLPACSASTSSCSGASGGVRTQPASAPSVGRGGSAGRARVELRFRIDHPLSYFTREYDPSNPQHDLRIGFASEADATAFRERVLDAMLELSQPSRASTL